MDWATISALATAGGTLVLAVATFASVRSANRSARTAERALLFNIGFWQGAIRDRSDELFAPMAATISAHEPFAVDILYFNAEGGQRTISRFMLLPAGDEGWLCSVGRHFSHDLPR